MKINGVIILRINDFKRFFDFQEFWSQKQEFIELFNQEGYLDFFCNTEDEKILCNLILNWLKNSPSSEGTCARDLIRITVKNIIGIDLRAWEIRQPIGLMALSVLVSDTLSTDNIEKWLETMQGNGIESGYYSLYEDRVFDNTEEPNYPLVAKPIVNNSSNVITIIVGENKKELSSGDCIVGLFDADGKCFKLLPNKNKNDDVELKLKFKNQRTYLEVETNNSKEIIDDVVSFYLQDSGCDYVYVTNRGDVQFSKKATIFIPKLINMNEHVLAILKKNNKYEVITITKIIR